ncbi:MAG: response regulator [Deltaproteobacteria bacterium]|nr:response regulator [Deltaproteobacteria bacterium]
MAYNILIVDDSQTMRTVIKKTVAISGFEIGACWEAGDGKEALEILDKEWVDVILTDLNMPRMNGLELVKSLKEKESTRHIPVVLITTEGSESRVQEAYALGIEGYIQKPFYPEAVRDALNKIMEKSHG